MTKLQEIEMSILQKFIEIANNEGLEWFAMFGTLLGAVRGGGFIPWDGDIDIALPREDYNRLMKMAHQIDEPFFLQTPFNDPAATPRYMRLRRSDTTAIPKNFPDFLTRGGNMGIYIDIIPLDIVPDYPAVVDLHNAAQTISRQMHGSAGLDENNGNPPKFKEYICVALGGIAGYYDFFAKRYEAHCARYDCGLYFATPVLSGEYGYRMYDRKWFDGYAELDFEGIKVRAPKNYGEVLTATYPRGQYEPTLEEQADNLDDFIIDTNKSYREYLRRYTDMLVGIDSKNVYLFGAGDSLRIWLERYGARSNIICIFDNNKEKWGSTIYGKKVHNPTELPQSLNSNERLIITSIYHKEISEKLPFDNHYVFVDGWNYDEVRI